MSAILVDPNPCCHIVYTSNDETLLIQAVCLFASSGVRQGESVVLIMAKSHCNPINRRLKAEGLNVSSLQKDGKLISIVADDFLSLIMVNGVLDENLFRASITAIINRARAGGNGSKSRVRIFGEMVSLLWKVNLAATTRLEKLWNEVIDAYGVSILCTYALRRTARDVFPESLIALHSHNIASQQ
jgi:hypothetical protein